YRRRWNQPAAQVAIARSRQGPASDRRFKIEAMEAAAELPTPEAASARSSIAELTPGQAFAGRYACVRKDRLTARNGSGYLSLEPEFRRAPCTRAGHHSYLGGLLEHTVAVGTLVGEVCVLHPRLDSELLTAAALLHDVGKTREFTYGAEIGLSEEGRLLGHLQI